MQKAIAETFSVAVGSKALIHCITNPISINQCANAVLALGCRPIMVEHPKEAADVTQTASALLLNLGNITDARIRSAAISAKTAHKNGIPFVLDAVGAGCSELRRKIALKIIRKYSPSIIKGNYSEITALCSKSYKSSGVDADASLDEKNVLNAAIELAKASGGVVLASGKSDLVTDGKLSFSILNGTERLSRVTGTGCMLGAVAAVMLTGGSPVSAAAAACGIVGISGELSDDAEGLGAFAVKLIDNIGNFNVSLFNRLRMEEIK